MNALLRLYPAPWRERYGEEFEALLEDVPPSPFDVIDIALAAIDARLRPQVDGGPGPRKETGMSRKQYGYAAIAGGLLWIVAFMWGSLMPMPIRELAFVLIPVAAIALLLALIGLSAVPARRRTAVAWVALLVPATATFISLGGMVSMLLLPDDWLLGFGGWHVMWFGILGMMAGWAFFGAVAFLVGTFSRRATALMAAGGLIGAATGVALLTVPWNPRGPDLAMVLASLVGIVTVGVAWIWLGYLATVRSPLPPRAAH